MHIVSNYLIFLQLPHGPNTDLTPGEHLVVNVRVYHPFKHSVGQRNARAIRCSQEFNVLGHQTLDVIKDAIFCTSDLSVAGNFASDPDRNRGPSAKVQFQIRSYFHCFF